MIIDLPPVRCTYGTHSPTVMGVELNYSVSMPVARGRVYLHREGQPLPSVGDEIVIGIDVNLYRMKVTEISKEGDLDLLVFASLSCVLDRPFSTQRTESYEKRTYKDLARTIVDEAGIAFDFTRFPDSAIRNSLFYAKALLPIDILKECVAVWGGELYAGLGNILTAAPRSSSRLEVSISSDELLKERFFTVNKGKHIGKVYINRKKDLFAVAEPALLLEIDKSPQPFREESRGAVYYSPLGGLFPKIDNLQGSFVVKRVTEKLDAKNTQVLRLKGNIRDEDISVKLLSAYTLAETKFTAEQRGVHQDLRFYSVPGEDILSGNNVSIALLDSGKEQEISSTLSGTGSASDPWLYTLELGRKTNTKKAKATGILDERIILTAKEFGVEGNQIYISSLIVLVGANDPTESILRTTGTNSWQFIWRDTFAPTPGDMQAAMLANPEFASAVDISFTQNGSAFSEGTLTLQLTGGVDYGDFGQNDNNAIAKFVSHDDKIKNILQCAYSRDRKSPPPNKLTQAPQRLSGATVTLQSIPFEYKVNDNLVVLEKRYNNPVYVEYNTVLYRAYIPASPAPKEQKIHIEHLGLEIDHTHRLVM